MIISWLRVKPAGISYGYMPPNNPHAFQLTPPPFFPPPPKTVGKSQEGGADSPQQRSCLRASLSGGVPSRSRRRKRQRDKKLQNALSFLLHKAGEYITCWVSHSRGGSSCLFFRLPVAATKTAPRAAGTVGLSRNFARVRGDSTFSSPAALSCLSLHGLSD